MTEDQWRDVVYRALGVPVAVTDRGSIAKELLAGKADLPEPAPGGSLSTDLDAARAGAEPVVLEKLPALLEQGKLDRALAGLELPDAKAEEMAMTMDNSGASLNAKARRNVLRFLLPLVVNEALKLDDDGSQVGSQAD